MTSMSCGCKIITGDISFDKRIDINNSFKLFILYHKHQQYVNVCGSCENKAKLFNDIEKRKLQLAKENFKVITEETVEEPETETDPDT